MANCTSYGSSGSNVLLPGLNIPNSGLTAFMSGFTQTGNKVTVAIWAPSGSAPVATIQGGGNNGTILAMNTASFSITASTAYYAVVTSTQPQKQTPQVLYNFDSLSYGTTTYAGTVTMCVEDTPNGGDCDFNDAVVAITWTTFAG